MFLVEKIQFDLKDKIAWLWALAIEKWSVK